MPKDSFDGLPVRNTAPVSPEYNYWVIDEWRNIFQQIINANQPVTYEYIESFVGSIRGSLEGITRPGNYLRFGLNSGLKGLLKHEMNNLMYRNTDHILKMFPHEGSSVDEGQIPLQHRALEHMIDYINSLQNYHELVVSTKIPPKSSLLEILGTVPFLGIETLFSGENIPLDINTSLCIRTLLDNISALTLRQRIMSEVPQFRVQIEIETDKSGRLGRLKISENIRDSNNEYTWPNTIREYVQLANVYAMHHNDPSKVRELFEKNVSAITESLLNKGLIDKPIRPPLYANATMPWELSARGGAIAINYFAAHEGLTVKLIEYSDHKSMEFSKNPHPEN